MMIYPSIDILNGQCVRLYQGNYECETVYSDSPFETAKQFLDQGAQGLHIVDLNGAKDPNTTQASLIKEVLNVIPITIQVGGGIRTQAQIDAYLEAGAGRVVIGSLAVESPKLVETWLQQYGPERLVLAFDVSFYKAVPYVMTQAWQKFNKVALFDVVRRFTLMGVKHLLCTDISRDGALNGPNLELYEALCLLFPNLSIQASGGISQLEDIRRLKTLNLAAAITGKALYEKQLTLSEALLC